MLSDGRPNPAAWHAACQAAAGPHRYGAPCKRRRRHAHSHARTHARTHVCPLLSARTCGDPAPSCPIMPCCRCGAPRGPSGARATLPGRRTPARLSSLGFPGLSAQTLPPCCPAAPGLPFGGCGTMLCSLPVQLMRRDVLPAACGADDVTACRWLLLCGSAAEVQGAGALDRRVGAA